MNYGKWSAFLLSLLISLPVFAQQDRYVSGTNYRELVEQLPNAGGEAGKVEVIEFFWYGCPHCYGLEPYVNDWLQDGIPQQASFIQVPAALNGSWENHARAYYVAEELGVLDQIHEPLFDAIHQGGQKLSDPDELRSFFVSQGVDGDDFDAAWNSYAVETKLRRANVLAKTAGISGVPSVIVGGRYEVTVSMAGGREELLEVINYLVSQDANGAAPPGN